MPPKKDSKQKNSTLFKDDNGNDLTTEQYMDYLEKKVKTACKNGGIQAPPTELIKTIRNVVETEDKSRKGMPFTSIVFSQLTSPEQLIVSLQILQNYSPLEDIIFNQFLFTTESFVETLNFVQKMPNIKNLTLIQPNLQTQQLKQLFQTVPQSHLIRLTLKECRVSSDVLLAAGVQIEKSYQQKLAECERAIELAVQQHTLELEEAKSKPQKKAKKPKKKSKKLETWQLSPQDLLQEQFVLQEVRLEFCMMTEECAPALGIFVEKTALLLKRLSFYGNEFKEAGMRAVGLGLQKAFQQVQYRKFEDTALEKECYFGSRFIKLESLDLGQCQIGYEDEAAKEFGEGVGRCGNLHYVNLDKNLFQSLGLLLFWFQKQWALTGVNVDCKLKGEDVDKLVDAMKTHKKKQVDTEKQLKKMAKANKKKAKGGDVEGMKPIEDENKENKEKDVEKKE